MISGNNVNGIIIKLVDAAFNVIVNNYIGTSKVGTNKYQDVVKDFGNKENGIKIEGAPSNIIGGQGASARNVISGNGGDGIWIQFADSQLNVIAGNYIGLASNGIDALGNKECGVRIDQGASNNIVGGAAEGCRNNIAGNTQFGVQFISGGTSNNTVQGNTIGKNANGDVKKNDLGWQADPNSLNNWMNNDHD